MQPVTVVKPGFGPTLPQLVGGLPRALRAAAIAFAALLVLAAATLAVLLRARGDERDRPRPRRPSTSPTDRSFERVTAPGSLLALRRERNGLFLDSYVVRPLDLPPYRGAAGGMLPVYAVHYLDELRRRYGPLQLAADGRTRINNGIGHQLVLRARRDGRTLYVRHLLLVPDAPEGARRGVIVEIESTPAAGTPNAVGVGNAGPLKQAMRSFRFGTERKGGTQ